MKNNTRLGPYRVKCQKHCNQPEGGLWDLDHYIRDRGSHRGRSRLITCNTLVTLVSIIQSRRFAFDPTFVSCLVWLTGLWTHQRSPSLKPKFIIMGIVKVTPCHCSITARTLQWWRTTASSSRAPGKANTTRRQVPPACAKRRTYIVTTSSTLRISTLTLGTTDSLEALTGRLSRWRTWID
jgi:hypothetical protein